MAALYLRKGSRNERLDAPRARNNIMEETKDTRGVAVREAQQHLITELRQLESHPQLLECTFIYECQIAGSCAVYRPAV